MMEESIMKDLTYNRYNKVPIMVFIENVATILDLRS